MSNNSCALTGPVGMTTHGHNHTGAIRSHKATSQRETISPCLSRVNRTPKGHRGKERGEEGRMKWIGGEKKKRARERERETRGNSDIHNSEGWMEGRGSWGQPVPGNHPEEQEGASRKINESKRQGRGVEKKEREGSGVRISLGMNSSGKRVGRRRRRGEG